MEKVKASPGILRFAAVFGAGFLLSGAGIAGIYLPASACLVAALTGGEGDTEDRQSLLAALFAVLGTVVGSLLRENNVQRLLDPAVCFLILTAGWALRETGLTGKRLWAPLSATVTGAAVGGLILFSQPITPAAVIGFGLRLPALFFGAMAAEAVLKEPRGVPMFAALFALISGSGGVFLPGRLSLGMILASGVVFSMGTAPSALPMAALFGLALDWRYANGNSAVATLVTACLAAGAAQKWKGKRRHGYGAGLLAAAVTMILTGGKGGEDFLAMAIGGFFSLLLPPMARLEESEPETIRCRAGLMRAADAMESVHLRLRRAPDREEEQNVSLLFDRATGKVCVTCARSVCCWKQNPEETRRSFREAAPHLLRRGAARREDFSPAFSEQCRHFPELLRVLDQELDACALRRQARRRQEELKRVLQDQYGTLAAYLRHGPLRAATETETPFCPDWVCRGRGKNRVSGDRAAGFRVGDRFYLLLCDGMGTGPEAAVDSGDAVELLSDLLRAGMAPRGALSVLNGLCVLEESGGSVTVDLAQTELATGETILYKWGSSPSYLKGRGGVRKIETASFPPGLCVGDTQQGAEIRLSLAGGEALILTTDGISGEDAETLLSEAPGHSIGELAAELTACGGGEGEDDKTAAVLRLQRQPSS